MSTNMETLLEKERRMAEERERDRIAPGLLEHRANEIIEAAAPLKRETALRAAAKRRYSRLSDQAHEEIVARALEIVSTSNGRAAAPRKAEASEPSSPTKESTVTKKKPRRTEGRRTKTSQLREPVRAIIGPLLQETPELTPREALDEVRAAGIEITFGVFQPIWQNYLREKGLDAPEVTKARRARAVRLQRKNGTRPSAAPRKRKASPAPTPAPEIAPPAPEQAPEPTSLPEAASILPAGMSLTHLSEGGYRIQLDVVVPLGAAEAFRLTAVVAAAFDAAFDRRGRGSGPSRTTAS